MGELPAGGFPLLRAIARVDRRAPRLRLLPAALVAAFALKPALRRFAAFVLQDALGSALPDGAAAVAPLWAAALAYAQKHGEAVRRTGLEGEGAALGEALFARMLSSRSGAPISTHTYQESWGFLRHADRRIHLEIPELLAQLRALPGEQEPREVSEAFPLVLVAGERRAYNANLIFRDPAWRKTDAEGALAIHPEDARRFGLTDGGRAICESRRGSLAVRVAVTDAVRPGMVTLPNGYGTGYPGPGGERAVAGPAVNWLTDARWRDPIAATPLHKHVRVRVREAKGGGN
jgi:anaerobic selenocysteine-containing dehydrogenase